MAGRLRMVYQQFDGEIELADCCTCFLFWDYSHPGLSFRIQQRMDCPIDEHKLAARRNQEAA